LEKAVRGIVDHMEQSERRNRDTLKSLQDRIGALGAKAQSTDSGELLRQAPAFSQLEQRLADLSRRVEKNETSNSTQTLADLLRREITDLAKRIDQVRDNSESLANRAQTQAVQVSQQELRAIEGRILGLLKEAQASLTGAATTPAEMQRLRGEIERLNRRIDETQSTPQQDPEVLHLRAAVEQLSTRVAQGPDMRPLADMDRRILDITQALEQTQAVTRSMPQLADLESRIAELDFRFNEAIAGRASAHSAEIEDRINEVFDRVGRTEQQLSSLETIERAVNQLFDSMEQQKQWTEQVAEGAANRMAERILAAGPQQVSLAGSPEIQALEQGLHAVRAAAEGADHRNQETLEAVHETLEQIVNKLSELETAAIGQRVAAAAAPQGATLGANQGATMAASMDAPMAYDMPAPAALHEATNNPFAAPLEQTRPTPQFEIPQAMPEFTAGPVQNPFEQPMAAPGLSPVDGDDFIAAARRAAQAAASQKSLLGVVTPGKARNKTEKSSSLFGLSFLSKKPKPAAASTAPATGEIKLPPGFTPAAANGNSEGKRKKLMMMGIVLLVAASAFFTFNMLGKSHKVKRPVQPATAIEEQLKIQDQKATAGAAADTTNDGAADDGTADQPMAEPQAPPAAGAPPVAPEAPAAAPLENGALEMPDADNVLTGAISPVEQGSNVITALVSGQAVSPEALPPAEVGNMALRKAAALGDANAEFVIANRYLNGEKVQQDFEKAAYWYGKAAAQGLAPAQYRVATMYERGRGVAKDVKAALGWYERAASLGNVKSMHNAAVIASGNELGAPDYVKAYKWFSLAAAHGLKDSQFNLAVLLDRGLGTEANKADAYFWYAVAASQDDKDASARAAILAKDLSQSALLAAKTRLASWQPDNAPQVANVVAINSADWQATAQN
jgi:localization factor PodJL